MDTFWKWLWGLNLAVLVMLAVQCGLYLWQLVVAWVELRR